MLGEDPFRKRLTSFSVGLPRTVCSFGNDFIALEKKGSLLTFHDDNFFKFHVLYACKGDACALKTRGRFVTERGKKKESRNLNPGLTAWVMNAKSIVSLIEELLKRDVILKVVVVRRIRSAEKYDL